jgi:hypothetical protein
MLTSAHALFTDPDASYQDLGADYYEQHMHTRQARNHVKSLERLGYKATSQALSRTLANPSPRPADPQTPRAARLAEVLFRTSGCSRKSAKWPRYAYPSIWFLDDN